MEIFGLHYVVWLVLIVYFAGMLLLGWWSKRRAQTHEGFLLGNRRFGVWMMIMHAFGVGTNPGDVTGVSSKTVQAGASGIWVSWMWLFGTPFYWLIAPVIRRTRCLTMADLYRDRFGPVAALLYSLVAATGMVVFFGGVMLATTRTVQGMMGMTAAVGSGGIDWSFYIILLTTTVTFAIYGYWGGIVAAIRTDMIQGIMIVVLSFMTIGPAIHLVGGLDVMRETLGGMDGGNYLSLFDSSTFSWGVVLLLCINSPLVALSFPHLMSVCAAGKTEWEGRMGFAGGNMLKRFCTIGWSLMALCWLAHLQIEGITDYNPDAAFGDMIKTLLPNYILQGLMLACVMAASMSTGDAFQVTVAGLFTQSVYREYINPKADGDKLLRVTRIAGLWLVAAALVFAILMQGSVVGAILAYFKLLGIIGVATALGILWRRMNTGGVVGVVLLGSVTYVLVSYFREGAGRYLEVGAEWKIALPLVYSIGGGIIGSLLTAKPDAAQVDGFFKKMYVPIGQEDKLKQTLDEAVPESKRLLTMGGLFIVKPSFQSWFGFLVATALCFLCIGIMLLILSA